jgi:hypothetical protein
LAFFAFFAFFAFLAMVSSSQGLMDGNATPRHARRRASLATSSRTIEQIRGALPRAVTSLSSRYPQLLCIFGTISPSEWILRRKNRTGRERSHHGAGSSGLTMRQRSGAFCIDPEAARVRFFINSKPKHGLRGGGESPLSGAAALYPPSRTGIFMGGLFDQIRGRAMRVPGLRC